jgi:hypothetical protein
MKKTHAQTKVSLPQKLVLRGESIIVLEPAQLGHAAGGSVLRYCTNTDPPHM